MLLENTQINQVVDKCLKSIKEELPEEAQTYEIYKYILQRSLEILVTKKIEL